jgi:hypothetical protein
MPGPICPECQQEKHENCDSTAWDWETDSPVPCDCWKRNHET